MADRALTGERQYSKEEEELEIQSLRRIIDAYLDYPDAGERDVRRYERSFKKLPSAHKTLLSHLPLKFQRIRWCISMNTSFIMSMLQAFVPPFEMGQDTDLNEDENMDNAYEHDHSNNSNLNEIKNDKEDIQEKNLSKFSNKKYNEDNDSQATKSCSNSCSHSHETSSHNWLGPTMQSNVPLVDVDKVRCIVRNIVRDWAEEGKIERDECYKPILEELNRLFPNRSKQSPPSCLVPGAGLGRLALEISSLGFESQGNEFSYYMMICSSFILNHAREANEWTIYPWIHSNCNSISDNDQLRSVSFPDILPSSAGITEGFSMCGGDFVEVYNDSTQEGTWDAVVTCFFLDTAHNIVEYIEIISKILKDGGVWINMGPLLYHFADAYGDDEMSVELSLEDVKKVAYSYGFVMEVEKMIETTYTGNRKSMMQNRYCAAFWTMRKKQKNEAVNLDKSKIFII